MTKLYDVVIIGAGPAGLTAAIYSARAMLKTLVIAGNFTDGQLVLASKVENFPGFSQGVSGIKLIEEMITQAKEFGSEFVEENVIDLDISKKIFELSTSRQSFRAKSIIVANGSSPKWLGLKEELSFIGKGLSSCATCDAYFFKSKDVAVVGGGDSAAEEALLLAKFAKKVILIHRNADLKASKYLQNKISLNSKIKVLLNCEVRQIYGNDFVQGIKIIDKSKSKKYDLTVDGLLVAIGHKPNVDMFKGKLKLTHDNHIYTAKDGITTSVKGIFAAGDIADQKYRQAITAAADGAKAAMEAERYLGNG